MVTEIKEKNVETLEIKDEKALKDKYGKIYRVTHEIMIDEEKDEFLEKKYYFKQPLNASYDRYIRTASKGMTKALKQFLSDNVIPEQSNTLEKDMEEYPAMALCVGQKLLAVLGYSDNVNLSRV